MPFSESGIWKPNPKQEKLIQVPDTVKEAAMLGGAGTGKTELLLMIAIARGWHKNPRFKQLFLRRTKPEIRNEVWPRSFEIYRKFNATPNDTYLTWTFPSGAKIFFGHCEHEKDVHQYDSMQITLFTPDELTSLTEYIYLYIALQRVRSADPAHLPALIRSTGMPGNIGHSWVKRRFIDPYPAGGKIIEGRGGVKRIFIHATVRDNKEYIDPTYMSSLEALPEAERKAKLDGSFDAYLGQVFDEFRDYKIPNEPENALHVVEPFEIPKWWPRFIIGDWGYTAMCYVGFYAVSPNGRLYLYRELYWYKTKIAEWGPVVKQFADEEEPKVVKFCKSAAQHVGQDKTIQQQIEEVLERPIELSNNSHGARIAGKMLVHEYLRWAPKAIIPADEVPEYSAERAMWILRNKGIIDYKNYLKMFDAPAEETNIPKLQIFRCSEKTHEGHPNCCPTMVDAIKACSYAKQTKDGKPSEDVAEFEGDDPYDDLRYACDTAEIYFNAASAEFEKVQQEAMVIDQLKNSQNYTAFYRQMRHIDEEERMQTVQLYHGRRRR